MSKEIDRTLRYIPERMLIVSHGVAEILPVVQYRVFPPNAHPDGCPIGPSYTALECVTERGSRWFGFERAYINSELRMVVSGFSALDEVRSKWEVAKGEATSSKVIMQFNGHDIEGDRT
jgi:hypothetical protein